MKSEKKILWSSSTLVEDFIHESLNVCIADYCKDEKDSLVPEDEVYFVEAEKVPFNALLDVDMLLQSIEEEASNYYGIIPICYEEITASASPARKELENLLLAWMEKHLEHIWEFDDIETHIITTKDLRLYKKSIKGGA